MAKLWACLIQFGLVWPIKLCLLNSSLESRALVWFSLVGRQEELAGSCRNIWLLLLLLLLAELSRKLKQA